MQCEPRVGGVQSCLGYNIHHGLHNTGHWVICRETAGRENVTKAMVYVTHSNLSNNSKCDALYVYEIFHNNFRFIFWSHVISVCYAGHRTNISGYACTCLNIWLNIRQHVSYHNCRLGVSVTIHCDLIFMISTIITSDHVSCELWVWRYHNHVESMLVGYTLSFK